MTLKDVMLPLLQNENYCQNLSSDNFDEKYFWTTINPGKQMTDSTGIRPIYLHFPESNVLDSGGCTGAICPLNIYVYSTDFKNQAYNGYYIATFPPKRKDI